MASAKTQIVDFSKVKEGGNFNKARIPAGDYAAVITKVEDAESKSDQIFQYLFTISKIKGHSQTSLPYYCKLQENQLWKLRNILIAAGKNVPKSKQKVDVNSLVGKTIGVTIDDTEYEGKEQSEIAAVFPAAELDDSVSGADEEDDAEDEAEGEEPEDEPEDEVEEEPEAEEETGDEYDAMDRLELRRTLKKLDPELKTSTKQSDDDLRDLIRGLVAGDAEAEEEVEEEEPEEEPEPVTRKVTRKPVAKKPVAKKPAVVSDDDLDELDIDEM